MHEVSDEILVGKQKHFISPLLIKKLAVSELKVLLLESITSYFWGGQPKSTTSKPTPGEF